MNDRHANEDGSEEVVGRDDAGVAVVAYHIYTDPQGGPFTGKPQKRVRVLWQQLQLEQV